MALVLPTPVLRPSRLDPQFEPKMSLFLDYMTSTAQILGAARASDHFNVIGTVAQSGGLATGALYQRGSGPGGTFLRFAGGWQICVSPVFTMDCTTTTGSSFRGPGATWTFPAGFSAVPVVDGGNTNSANGCWSSGANSTTTAATVNIFSSISQTARTATFTAIGRWF